MNCFSLSHLADHALSRELSTLATQEWAATARLVACLAEFDERRLYLPAGHPSMFAYCVRELHMSEDAAFKRIRAARAAREFRAIFHALSEGRLHLSAVVLLAPHLRPDNVDELLAAATHRSKAEIELLLAERFPQPDVPELMRAVAAPGMREPGPAQSPSLEFPTAQAVACMAPTACERKEQLAPGPVVPSRSVEMPAPMGPVPSLIASRAKLSPLAPGRFALQLTVNQATHDLLRYAQALLGHTLPSSDVAEVIERALRDLVEKLEKQKFAKAVRVRPRRGAADGRHVPAEIRRAVWQRDAGQCTFVSDKGHRCEARTRLEFDHIQPVARGGRTTVANTRLRCRAHNQYAAECTFGAGFMREKREMARHRAADKQARAETRPQARPRAGSEVHAHAAPHPRAEALPAVPCDKDVIPWLRQLGYCVEQARRGAALVAHIPDASLEERVKAALRGLAPAGVRRIAPVPGPTS